MGATKATEKKATDAKATTAKTTGAKASGAKASGATAKTHTTATPPEGAQDTATRTAASKVVDATADAIKTAAASSETPSDGPPRPEIGDGSLDRTPTATQIVTPDAFPNATEKKQEPKFVRHDTPPGVVPGAADPTTIVEEVRVHDPKDLSTDRDEMIQTMRVLAHSQGMNQSVKLGNGKVLTVLQNGEVREDEVPDIPAAATEKEKPE